MENKPESHLWEQIDRLIFIIAFLGLIILVGAYFFVGDLEGIDSALRDLILNVITNIVPTFLLFIGAYLVFRKIEKLRSERDADELAEKVVFKLLQILTEIQASSPNTNNEPLSFVGEDIHMPLDMKLRQEFDVVAKPFDSKSDPQRIIVNCTYRGANNIYVKKITYHGTDLDAKKHLSDIYALDGFNAIISEEQVKISSGIPYTFDLILAKTKKWKKSEIETWYERLGYLYFDIEYDEQVVKYIQKRI